MDAAALKEKILSKRSYLCVGLDPDLQKLPSGISRNANGVVEFCKKIVDATLAYSVSYKLNTAFFESLGKEGWAAMELVFGYLQNRNVFVIADAKRGDIGNTSAHYAKAFFEEMGADAITLAPYMGQDSIQPFLEYPEKTAIVLALTSNPGHADFEMQKLANGQMLYEKVMEKCLSWPRKGNLMFVVGATRSSEMANIRKVCPDSFFLVPGVGAQGGDLAEISKMGFNDQVGLLINASRSIIYASSSSDFEKAAATEAEKLQLEMDKLLSSRNF